MKPHRFIFIICSLGLLLACKQKDQNTKELESYLKTTHALLPNDSAIYCFFPANQCKNCFLYNARFITAKLNNRVIIVSGFDSTNFKGFKNFHQDAANAMLGLSVLDYGNRIITFKDGGIKHTVVVKDLYTQLDSTAQTMSW